MGKRLHLHTKHDIEYADFSHFNYDQERVYYLLSSLGVNVYDGTEDYFGDDIEISRSELEEAYKVLSGFISNSNGKCVSNEDIDVEDVKDNLQNLYHNADFVGSAAAFLGVIDLWLKNAPGGSEFIYLSWF